LHLRTKLIIGFVLLAGVPLIGTGYSVSSLDDAAHDLSVLRDQHLDKAGRFTNAHLLGQNAVRIATRIVAARFANPGEITEAAEKEFSDATKAFEEAFKSYRILTPAENEEKLAIKATEAWKDYSLLIQQIIRLSRSKDTLDQQRLTVLSTKEFRRSRLQLADTLDGIQTLQFLALQKAEQQATRSLAHGKLWLWVLGILAVLASAGMGLLLMKTFWSRLGQIAEKFQKSARDQTGGLTDLATRGKEILTSVADQRVAFEQLNTSTSLLREGCVNVAQSVQQSAELAKISTGAIDQSKEELKAIAGTVAATQQGAQQVYEQIETAVNDLANSITAVTQSGLRALLSNEKNLRDQMAQATTPEAAAAVTQAGWKSSRAVAAVILDTIKKTQAAAGQGVQRVKGLTDSGKSLLASSGQFSERFGETLDQMTQAAINLQQISDEFTNGAGQNAEKANELETIVLSLDQLTELSLGQVDGLLQEADRVQQSQKNLDTLTAEFIALFGTTQTANNGTLSAAPTAQIIPFPGGTGAETLPENHPDRNQVQDVNATPQVQDGQEYYDV